LSLFRKTKSRRQLGNVVKDGLAGVAALHFWNYALPPGAFSVEHVTLGGWFWTSWWLLFGSNTSLAAKYILPYWITYDLPHGWTVRQSGVGHICLPNIVVQHQNNRGTSDGMMDHWIAVPCKFCTTDIIQSNTKKFFPGTITHKLTLRGGLNIVAILGWIIKCTLVMAWCLWHNLQEFSGWMHMNESSWQDITSHWELDLETQRGIVAKHAAMRISSGLKMWPCKSHGSIICSDTQWCSIIDDYSQRVCLRETKGMIAAKHKLSGIEKMQEW
jgi:hypothetical protein